MPNELEVILANEIANASAQTVLSMNSVITSMQATGMSSTQIKAVLMNDLTSGGRLFGGFRSQIRNTVKNGVEYAGNTSSMGAFEDAGIKEFIWVTVGGGKVCADCESRSGQVGTNEFWRTVGRPKSGFSVCQQNCRCQLVASNYKGENLNKPLLTKRKKKVKQDFGLYSKSMAGKHKTKSDTIKWAEKNHQKGVQYINEGRSRFSGRSPDIYGMFKYKYITIDQANKFNKLFSESFDLSDKLGIPRLRGFTSVRGKFAMDMGDGIIGVSKTSLNRNLTDKWWGIQKELIKKGKYPSSSVSFAYKTKDKITLQFWHEYGHHIHQQLNVIKKEQYFKPPFEIKVRKIYTKLKEKSLTDAKFRSINYPSTYSMTDSAEWFAENFTLYKNGFKKRVSKEFIRFLKENGLD